MPADSTPCPVCRGRKTVEFASVASRDYRRCNACEAVFLDPSQLPDEQSEAERYRLHDCDPGDRGYVEHLNNLVRPLLERLTPKSYGLDYGCGPAAEPALAGLLTRAGHSVRLYDPLFRPDLATLDEGYDFITCSEVAEHFHHPADEFELLNRLLRPGGWLGVMTRFLADNVRFKDWHYRRDPTHVVFYRPETFRRIAARFGWHCEFPGPDLALMRQSG